MNLERYPELKAAGKVTLQFLGNQVIAISKKYDADLGTELDDSIISVDVTSLNKQKADLQTKLDAITLFLTDVRTEQVKD